MSSNSSANLKIVVLILLAGIIPLIGFFVSAHLERELWQDDWAAAVWTIAAFSSALYLTYANRIAQRTFGLKAFAPFAFLAWIGSALSVGWVTNNAWYNYDSFSGFVAPDYSVRQHRKHPNHFLFNGPMEIGAAGYMTEYILSAEKVNWDEPVVLEINSEGGSPQVGILIGEFIRLYNIQVEVMGQCISACTFALMSSEHRYIHPRAWIGFHAAYIDAEEGPDYADADLAFYDGWRDDRLEKLGAKREFIERARVQDASGGFFPSYNELRESKISNTEKRAYLSSEKLPGYL